MRAAPPRSRGHPRVPQSRKERRDEKREKEQQLQQTALEGGGGRATVRFSRELSERLDMFQETIETILSFLHQDRMVTLVNKMPQLTLLHLPAQVRVCVCVFVCVCVCVCVKKEKRFTHHYYRLCAAVCHTVLSQPPPTHPPFIPLSN